MACGQPVQHSIAYFPPDFVIRQHAFSECAVTGCASTSSSRLMGRSAWAMQLVPGRPPDSAKWIVWRVAVLVAIWAMELRSKAPVEWARCQGGDLQQALPPRFGLFYMAFLACLWRSYESCCSLGRRWPCSSCPVCLCQGYILTHARASRL
jgi:hypothetical protein